jgi:hypothetical protein
LVSLTILAFTSIAKGFSALGLPILCDIAAPRFLRHNNIILYMAQKVKRL